jgi:hypothetical protein
VSTLGNPFWDWAVIGLFYAALQYIDGYFAAKNVPLPSNMDHTKRLTLVQRYSGLKPIFNDYSELYNESRYARYDPGITFDQRDVNRLKTNLKNIKDRLAPELQ